MTTDPQPSSEPVTQTAVEHQFDELTVDAPHVGIVMGSKSDMPVMEKAGKELEERGIRYEIRVMSAHRDPDVVADYAKNAKMRGLRAIIAGAGLAAALPGVVAAHTELPVIGVPLTSKTTVRSWPFRHSRSDPGPESSRVVTWHTLPPRPPSAAFRTCA